MKRATLTILMVILALALSACRDETPQILDITSVPTLDPIVADTYTSFDDLGSRLMSASPFLMVPKRPFWSRGTPRGRFSQVPRNHLSPWKAGSF